MKAGVKHFGLLLIGLLFAFQLTAGWETSAIPEHLTKDANNVVRLYEVHIEMINSRKLRITREFVVTVLNEDGRDAALLVIHYDKQSSISGFDGELFDRNGKRTKRLRIRDLYDRSNVGGFSLYEDNRIKMFRPTISQYPYTVRYKYTVTYNHTAVNPRFRPVWRYKQSVQQAVLVYETPQELGMNHKTFNMEGPENTIVKNKSVYTWKIDDVQAFLHEPYSPPVEEIFPMVLLSPMVVAYNAYEGSAATWEDYGAWVAALNAERQQLPATTIEMLKRMVSTAETAGEKAAILYEYLQGRTRYVNISIGIGGVQPIEASTVDRVGYGDCKALSNYMMAMLQAVDVDAYYTLINSGRNKYSLHAEVPGTEFNHAILCVPDGNDTIWLECTSQQIPFGYIGRGNHNRPVLLITEEGGKMARTKSYFSHNRKTSTAHIQLDAVGNGKANISMKSEGLYYGDMIGFDLLTVSEQEKWIYSNHSFPNYHINGHSIENTKERLPSFTLNMDISLRSYARSTANRLFVPLDLLRNSPSQPRRVSGRKTPFVINNPYQLADTIVFTIPEGYTLESSIADIAIDNDFGSYQASVELVDNRVVYTRRLEMRNGKYPANDYAAFAEFLSTIATSDKRQLVFRKSDD